MAKDKIFDIYRILLLYEDVMAGLDSTTESDYVAYCNRMAVRFRTVNQEVSETIEGLAEMGMKLPKHTVRSCVLHMTNMVAKQLGGDA